MGKIPFFAKDVRLTRRQFIHTTASATFMVFSSSCEWGMGSDDTGRLKARPVRPVKNIQPGRHRLGISSDRDGLLCIPSRYTPSVATPLLMMLHGAGGNAESTSYLIDLADYLGITMLVPESRDRTWDVSLGGFGPDVLFIDLALKKTFECCSINLNQLALAGFSDGASYALSLGLTNGDLFNHIVAFSPGFMKPADRTGKPDIFISHGRHDQILPVELGRDIAARLKRWHYSVRYEEFVGPHTIPPEIALEGMRWVIQ